MDCNANAKGPTEQIVLKIEIRSVQRGISPIMKLNISYNYRPKYTALLLVR